MSREEDTDLQSQEPKRALLVTAPKGQIASHIVEEHLDELELLGKTYGIEAADKVVCPIRRHTAATFVTSGKLDELVARAKELAVDLIVFDDEISPAQQRNLEKAFGLTVMDRTEIIIEVFAQRAHSREARLQVELARVRYQLPRLKRLWTHLSRQAGTGGAGAYLKGEGEKQIEIDRRILKHKVDKLQKDLIDVASHRETLRAARTRSSIPIFGLVGYTNAGKSSLLNALTEAEVFVEDKLFATLDTTTRKFTLRNNQEVLLIDTVGFIRKLPHQLVAAFRSTLEEAVMADVLLHIVDASNPAALDQARTTLEVLEELGAHGKPIITVVNKVDKEGTEANATRLRVEHTHTVQISAKTGEGFDALEQAMIEELQKSRCTMHLRIPQSEYAVVSEVTREGHILMQDYEENDVCLKVDIPTVVAGHLGLDQYCYTPTLVDDEES